MVPIKTNKGQGRLSILQLLFKLFRLVREGIRAMMN